MFEIVNVPASPSPRIEPMGTKEKFWYDDPTRGRCLFKRARTGTGEDWAEKIAEELCRLVELPHATYDLAIWNGVNGTVSPRFTEAEQQLVHGNELLIERDPDYATGSQTYRTSAHTVEAVIETLRQRAVTAPAGWSLPGGMQDGSSVFVGYLMLDALVGNTDRHHENWAVIQDGGRTLHESLAPTFDHASSLGRNETDARRAERLTSRDAGNTPEAYAARCRSALHRSSQDAKPLLTIDAFAEAAQYDADAAVAWLHRLEQLPDTAFRAILDRAPPARMSDEARSFALRILTYNRARLLDSRRTYE